MGKVSFLRLIFICDKIPSSLGKEVHRAIHVYASLFRFLYLRNPPLRFLHLLHAAPRTRHSPAEQDLYHAPCQYAVLRSQHDLRHFFRETVRRGVSFHRGYVPIRFLCFPRCDGADIRLLCVPGLRQRVEAHPAHARLVFSPVPLHGVRDPDESADRLGISL